MAAFSGRRISFCFCLCFRCICLCICLCLCIGSTAVYRVRLSSTFFYTFGLFGCPALIDVAALTFLDRLFIPDLPVLGMIQKPPAAINWFNPPPFKVRGSAIGIRGKKGVQGDFYVLQRDTGAVGKPWNRRPHPAGMVGHSQHGNPDEAGAVWLAPYG